MNKKKKSRFANVVISICVAVGLCITLATMWDYHMLGVPVPGDVLTALFLFWGGELLIIALRQIFGSDITKKNKTEDITYENIEAEINQP